MEGAGDTVTFQFHLNQVVPEVFAVVPWFIRVPEDLVGIRSACRAGGSGVWSG